MLNQYWLLPKITAVQAHIRMEYVIIRLTFKGLSRKWH